MSNPLRDIAPGRWRRVAYSVIAAIGVGITGLTAGFAAVGSDIPHWLIFTAAFYGTVTGPVWAVPASNVGVRS